MEPVRQTHIRRVALHQAIGYPRQVEKTATETCCESQVSTLVSQYGARNDDGQRHI
jgi:hypothetical protein